MLLWLAGLLFVVYTQKGRSLTRTADTHIKSSCRDKQLNIHYSISLYSTLVYSGNCTKRYLHQCLSTLWFLQTVIVSTNNIINTDLFSHYIFTLSSSVVALSTFCTSVIGVVSLREREEGRKGGRKGEREGGRKGGRGEEERRERGEREERERGRGEKKGERERRERGREGEEGRGRRKERGERKREKRNNKDIKAHYLLTVIQSIIKIPMTKTLPQSETTSSCVTTVWIYEGAVTFAARRHHHQKPAGRSAAVVPLD